MADDGATKRAGLLSSEDWLAIWLGAAILLLRWPSPILARPADFPSRVAEVQAMNQKVLGLRNAESPGP